MSREVVGDAIGRLIFLKLSQEQRKELFQKVPASGPNWGVISRFTQQALRSPAAARTLSTHFVEHMAVLHKALEPQVFLGGASMCTADVVCYVALVSAMQSLSCFSLGPFELPG